MPFAPCFDITEAETLISFSAIFQGATPPLVTPDVPTGWTNLFTSPDIGAFNNAWQLWGKDGSDQYAVVIRGTIETAGSIFEDVMAVMIPGSGMLQVGSVSLDYKLANDPDSAVHFGFALGLFVLLYDATNGILSRLETLPDGSQIFIAGHSQGAAIATLCRSYLEYSTVLAVRGFSYKTYVFAQPKPGNDHYGWDFERIASNRGLGFRVTNSQDWVPQVPLTIQLLARINEPNILDELTGNIAFKLFTEGFDALESHLEEIHLAKHIPQVSALERILKSNASLTLAASTADAIQLVPTLNFTNCGSSISLPGTPGNNPTDPKDFFWQHHAAMYLELLKTAFP